MIVIRAVFEKNRENTIANMYDGKAIADASQAIARQKILMSSSTLLSTKITRKKRRMKTRLSKEVLREVSLSKWPFL